MFCIKDNLKKSLGLQLENDVEGNIPRTRLWRLINDYVSRARDITIRMSMLDHLHTLRMCENFEQGNINAFVDHDQKYYYDLAHAVCGRRVTTAGLQATVNGEYSQIFPANEALDFGHMSTFMAEIANASIQNFNEHISRNTQPIFCRLMILKMNLDPNFQDNVKIKGKLALHIFKLLSNQMTVWPHSVPQTEARFAKCHTLIEEYFPWFQFLLINNDEDEDDDAIELNNISEDDDPIDLDYVPEEDEDLEEDDPYNNMEIIEDDDNILDPWAGVRSDRMRYGYPDNIKRNPTLFLPLIYNSLVEIEIIKDRIDNEEEVRPFPRPINQIPRGYLGDLFRRILSKGRRNEMYPKNFMSKLVKKTIKTINFIVQENQDENNEVNLQIVRNLVAGRFLKDFQRRDYDLPIVNLDNGEDPIVPLVLSAADQELIVLNIARISQQIINGQFRPDMRFGILGAKMSSIVPHHSFMRRHIPISRENFRSLLYHSGYPNLP